MAEEENESDEQATHQNMRFTVRLRIVHSVGAHTVPQPRHNESSSAEDDEDDLPLATALPAAATGIRLSRQRRYRQQLQTTAVRSV